MNDNEVEAVIGHEMGHVALGHVKKGMQVALGTNAVRAAAASAAASSAACRSRSWAIWARSW
ncbi:peptidase M48 Ste24p [Klebsiella michiganensis]|nr:peptidase M48 Ste24p [Klebsiella michiganensis]